jgi:phosphoserine phosphatase
MASTEEMLRKLGDLEAKALPLKELRDNMNDEVRKAAEERDKLNERARELKSKAMELRAKRDELNDQIQELKKFRESSKTDFSGLREQSDRIKEELKTLQSQMTGKERRAKSMFKKLEWKLQTDPTNLQDEVRIIRQLKGLEGQIKNVEQIDKLRAQLMEVNAQIRSERIKSNDVYSQIRDLAQASQENHVGMLESLKELDAVKAEADSAHQRFLESKKKADESHHGYINFIIEIKEMERQLHQNERNLKMDQVQRVLQARDETAKEASEKLKKGDKLTFDEFKLLVERGMI